MGLRILDDDRPGFALLEFSQPMSQDSLELSFRLLRDDQYLGPGGKWGRQPQYIAAQKVDADVKSTRYRVGPDVVDYMLDHERIEVVSKDGQIHEQALWENAVPRMPGQSTQHSIYRTQAPRTVVKEEPPRSETPPPVYPPREETGKPEPQPPPPAPRRRWWLVAVPLLLLLAGGAAIGLSKSVRCQLLGQNCSDPADLRKAALDKALECARDKPVCEVSSCFEDYLALVPRAEVPATAESILKTAERSCDVERQKEQHDAQAARDCAKEKSSTGLDCEVREKCVAALYLVKHAWGASKDELERLASAADQACQSEGAAASVARTCVDTYRAGNDHCMIEDDCISPYRRAFRSGPSLAQFDELAADARKACEEAKRDQQRRNEEEQRHAREEQVRAEETRALQSAKQCAANAANACVRALCYSDYLRRYESSAQGQEARVIAEQAKRECDNPVFGNGTYLARTKTACGASAQSVRIVIKDGQISWEHEAQGIKFLWQGTIDPKGEIKASVGGSPEYAASGRYDGDTRDVTVRYPQCPNEPIVMTIFNRLN